MVASIAVLFLLLLNVTVYSQAQEENYATTSWALGIVIPEDSSLTGGGKLKWESVRNVTVFIDLPNMSQPDNIVYAVLSVMTNDSSVLQVAAGIFPNESSWLVYAWIFTDLSSTPVKFEWILNGSRPEMSPSAHVSISIFLSSSGSWNLLVLDLDTGASMQQTFPSGVAPSLKIGDQEVFAFESYSRSAATFEEMGNLTLSALLFDGKNLSSGFYQYDSGWNPKHNPLFVIGTVGTIPPPFISLQNESNNSIAWSYSNSWVSNELIYPGWVGTIVVVALLSGSMIAVAVVIKITRKLRR